jgi:hypothetical protein
MKVAAGGREMGFGMIEAALHLALLVLDPFRLVPVLRPPAALVDLEQGRIHDAVGERLLAQGLETVPAGGDDAPAPGQVIEIIHDDAGIVEGLAVLQDQGGDLSEGVLLAKRIVRVERIRLDDLDAVGEAQERGRDLDLAAEGRCGRGAENEHGEILP